MSVKVTKDGQMVERSGGVSTIANGTRSVVLGYTTIEFAGAVIADDELDAALVERVKAGDGPDGLAYLDALEEAESGLVDLTAEVQSSQGDPAPNSTSTEVESELTDDLAYDPDKHNQAQVLAYLKTASSAEVERVKAKEAGGQNRQQIAAYNPTPFEG